MESVFHVRLERDESAWTVFCGGELDLVTAPRLESAVDLCSSRVRPTALHIDGTDLTFIDSTGIATLVRLARLCNEETIDFRVTISDQVREALTRAGLAERLLMRAATPTA